jgi:hypothetical protein
MAKAVGIGGIFIEFKGEKEEVQAFYNEHLGLDMSAYGSGFLQGEQLMLLSFKRDSEEMPLINFRVDRLEELIYFLREKKIQTEEIQIYPYGSFTHFTDPFGNYIELWEPKEDVYREMVKKEIELYEIRKK